MTKNTRNFISFLITLALVTFLTVLSFDYLNKNKNKIQNPEIVNSEINEEYIADNVIEGTDIIRFRVVASQIVDNEAVILIMDDELGDEIESRMLIDYEEDDDVCTREIFSNGKYKLEYDCSTTELRNKAYIDALTKDTIQWLIEDSYHE